MASADLVIRMVLCLFAMQGCVNGLPASSIKSMILSRMEKADMETSATGYSYHQQHGAPASYVHYNNQDSGHYYNAPAPVSYIAPAPQHAPVSAPIAYGAPQTVLEIETVPLQYAKQTPANYGVRLPAGYIVPLLPQRKEPSAPYFNVPITVAEIPQKVEIVDDDDDDDDETDDHDGDDDEDDDDEDDDEEDGPEHPDFDVPHTSFDHGFVEPAKTLSSSNEHGEGAKHEARKYSAHGEKGDKAYKKYHGFDNGEKGEHDSENHKGQYNEEAGNKKSHSDTAGQYGEHDEGSKGEIGASYGVGASHKKGHKTKGFHNVYHKDEYKKDTDFYDDAHRSGSFEKHGSFGNHHASAEGGFKKGGHHDSAHSENEAAKKGEFNKGHDNEESKGHKAAEGQESYHENHADYAAKHAASEGKQHGYSKGHREPAKYST